jgi:hypothetical protein
MSICGVTPGCAYGSAPVGRGMRLTASQYVEVSRPGVLERARRLLIAGIARECEDELAHARHQTDG